MSDGGNNSCSSSLAGGEVNANLSSSNGTRPIQAIIPNSQFSNCVINFNTRLAYKSSLESAKRDRQSSSERARSARASESARSIQREASKRL